MNKIQTVGMRSNRNPRSRSISQQLRLILSRHGYPIVESRPDLWISVGGDGAFLRMVRESRFDTHSCYIGVHTGTLGFLQEVSPEHLEQFADYLDKGEYKLEYRDILQTRLVKKDKSEDSFCSLNETVIRSAALKTFKTEIRIDGTFFEKFAGDGIMVSTSTGSTAYNMSFGGSVVDNSFSTMQLTPMAPLSSRTYHTLLNSYVMPHTRTIELVCGKNPILVTADGSSSSHADVERVFITTQEEKLPCLAFDSSPYLSKIHEKLL